MRQLNRSTVKTKALPIKVLQFGEGNFLRAFADWIIDVMNKEHGHELGVAVVQPIDKGLVDVLNDQDCLYHHIYRGVSEGRIQSKTRLIECIQKAVNPFQTFEEFIAFSRSEELEIVISNTTEAGIVFQEETQPGYGQLATTFPGKLTQLLWTRFQYFKGAPERGLKFLPVELIDKNGEKLRRCILQYAEYWNLSATFIHWVNNDNHFANTLVDRIVPGFPKAEIKEIQSNIGFEDKLVVSSESFHLWVIEGSETIQKVFPADESGFNVIYTTDLTPYRSRKVRILNGAHTSMVPVGLLNGLSTVRDAVEHNLVGEFIQHIVFKEIIPTIDLPKNELESFANDVLDRFRNPFIVHELKSISLNSISKFKVRVLPSLLDFLKLTGELPKGLVLALTHLIKLYLSEDFHINDDVEIKEYFHGLRAGEKQTQILIEEVLGKREYWGQDLNTISGLSDMVCCQFEQLEKSPSKLSSLFRS